MAISRRSKTWIVVLSIPVVIVIAGVITLKMLFTSERLKAYVLPKIEEATHRTVTVNTINLSILPTIAVEVEGLVVSNAHRDGFSDKPILQLDRLVLDVRLVPLLKGSIEVSTVKLEHPQLYLEVNEQGSTNYSMEEAGEKGKAGGGDDFSRADSQPTGTRDVKSDGYGLLLSNLEIINGVIEYIDRKGNSAITIDGMDHRVRAEAPPNATEIAVELHSTIARFSYGSLTTPLVPALRLTSSLGMVYNVNEDVLRLNSGTATIQDIPLTVSGEVAECTTLPIMNLRIESDKVSIPELLSLIPKEYMEKAEGVKGNGVATAKIEVKGSVSDSTTPDLTGTISAINASIQYPQLPKSITDVTIIADFARTKTRQEFIVRKFSAELGDNPLGATMAVVNFDDPSLTMSANVSVNLGDVKDYYPLEAGTELSGALKASVNIAGKVSNPSAMKASGTMEFQTVTIRTPASKNPVQNLNGVVTFSNQFIEARKLSMNLGKSDLSMAFTVKNYLSMMSDGESPKATANLNLTSNHLFTSDIMGDEGKSPPENRQPPGSQRKDGGVPQDGPQKRVQEKETGSRQSGVPLPNVDMDVAATMGMLTLEKFELRNVRSTMKIANGIITLQSFTGNMFEGSVSAKGKLNLQKPESPSYDLTVDMNTVDAHAMLPKFTSFGQKMFGKLSMSTTLSGRLDDTLGLVTQGLNGLGRVGLQEGKLTGVKVNQTIASMLKLPDVEEIDFKDWANTFSIADGRIVIKDLKINALGADYFISGSQGLDGSLDFGMSMVLSEGTSAKVSVPGFAGEALRLFKEPSGRVKLDFTIGGTYDDPKVALDTRPAQKKAEDLAKQKLTEETKKLGEKAKEKAGELFKDLFKKKK